MKAYLEMEMPESCGRCDFYYERSEWDFENGKWIAFGCCVRNTSIKFKKGTILRHPECPLMTWDELQDAYNKGFVKWMKEK